MIENNVGSKDCNEYTQASENSVPKDHPFHKDKVPKHLNIYDYGVSAEAVVVGSAEFIDGRLIQKRAIEFRKPNGEFVWADRQRTKRLTISEEDIKNTRIWFEKKYKPQHADLVLNAYSSNQQNCYPEPENIERNLAKYEEMLGIENPS